MWEIQIRWNFAWVTVQKGFKTRQDAEWVVGMWKQENRCLGDPFRAIESPPEKAIAVPKNAPAGYLEERLAGQ